MAYPAAGMRLPLPVPGRRCSINNKSYPCFLSHKKFILGRPLYATVHLLVAVGYRLGWVVPSTISIRKSMQLVQVLKAELEESNIENAEVEEVEMREDELGETNMQKEVREPDMRKEEEPKLKKANLFASRSERMYLPIIMDSTVTTKPLSSFFSRPSGTKSILNISALQDFQYLGPNTYRCTLPKMKFLKFEVAPVLDLQVTTTCEECIVELLSCRLEGSKLLENQNKHFSATAKNHITWNMESAEPFVDINVELNVILKVYGLPFSLLPVSAVERPGNVVLQSLINQLVPTFLEQLLEDYNHWVETGAFESERESLFPTKPNIELDEA